MKKPTINKPLAGAGAGGGLTLGLLVRWAWNGLVPDYPMGEEEGLAVAFLLGGVCTYASQWLPRPEDT